MSDTSSIDAVMVEKEDASEVVAEDTKDPELIDEEEEAEKQDDDVEHEVARPEKLQHAAAPVQIVSIGNEEDAYAFSFHKDTLNEILNKVPKKEHVAVVSVVGAFRTGKSFLLSWFLKYLHSDANGEAAKDWYTKFDKLGGGPGSNPDDSDAETHGFDWRGGSERNTTGIWMWSEPFSRTRADGSKISVLLVDTQGMFDHETTMALTAAIFGLSTLLSSHQIYNVDKRIQEDNLQQLALFSEYGRMALQQERRDNLDDDCDEKSSTVVAKAPFQSIEFLVRDWQNFEDDEDEELMEKEMPEYLETVLKERDAKDLQETRDHILSSFEKISCFMMTHPGFAVTKKKYEGDISKIEPTFLMLLDKFCRKVFGDNLQPKTIHGRELTAPELAAFMEAYALLFKNGASFPEASTMLEATASANNTVAVNATISSYVEEMDEFVGPDAVAFRREEDFRDFHDSVMSKSMRAFDGIATFGSSNSIQKARLKVIADITQRLSMYEKLNESRNPLAGLETFLIPSGIAVMSYILRTIADATCSSWSQTCRASSDALSHILAVAFIFLFIVYLTKAKQIHDKFKQIKSAASVMFADDGGSASKGATDKKKQD